MVGTQGEKSGKIRCPATQWWAVLLRARTKKTRNWIIEGVCECPFCWDRKSTMLERRGSRRRCASLTPGVGMGKRLHGKIGRAGTTFVEAKKTQKTQSSGRKLGKYRISWRRPGSFTSVVSLTYGSLVCFSRSTGRKLAFSWGTPLSRSATDATSSRQLIPLSGCRRCYFLLS